MNRHTAEFDRDLFRMSFARFIRSAFQILPLLEQPTILDIGCGSGVPTIELANLSGGMITAIDTNQNLLDKLQKRCIQLGLTDRIEIRNLSMKNMDFEEGVFDLIWAEGSIFVVGFANGLREWRPLLKKNGFLVVHDRDDNVVQKRKQVSESGYVLLGHIDVTPETWGSEYYDPLEKHIKEREEELESQILVHLRNEIETFRRQPIGSIYFIMQKSESEAM
ncbi:MAG: class I SAM-dependent methyltransferase [Candidatus Thorarchaeota archaeon]